MTRFIALALAASVSMAGVSVASAHSSKHHRKHHQFQSSQSSMSGTQSMSGTRSINNPTPTKNDPPGTRTQCLGGCQ